MMASCDRRRGASPHTLVVGEGGEMSGEESCKLPACQLSAAATGRAGRPRDPIRPPPSPPLVARSARGRRGREVEAQCALGMQVPTPGDGGGHHPCTHTSVKYFTSQAASLLLA